MWFEKSYRRHLCDMHIDDWDEKFLSQFSVDEYVENLKKARIQSAMIYVQAHTGLCYFPTKVGTMHSAFVGKEDTIKKLIDKCHDNNIDVIVYYSLIYNNAEYHKHPEWRMMDVDGDSWYGGTKFSDNAFAVNTYYRYGLCCPNNPEYVDFVMKQIEEFSTYFDFEGAFYDMPFWAHPCYCESCKKRWREEVGGVLPTVEDWNDPNWLLHMEKRRKWMGEFTQKVADKTKELNPGVSVEQNFAAGTSTDPFRGTAEEVNDACDYCGGDLYGNLYAHSFTCKYYKNITKNPPFEYMFARCEESLSKHTLTKSKDVMLSAASLTAAHHGATLVIDAIDPVGTMDERVYNQIGEVFEQLVPYDKYYYGDMIEDVGVYYSLKSKFNPYGEKYMNHYCAVNSIETLVRNNIPCGVTGSFGNFEKHSVLVAPLLTSEDEYENQRIIDYVKDGGCLYISGADNKALIRELLGGECSKRTVEKVVYIAPNDNSKDALLQFNKKYPLHFDGSAPVLTGIDNEDVIATITLPYTKQDTVKFVSIHSNPPMVDTEIPAIVYREYGKGKVLWSAVPIETLENYHYRRVFISLLKKFFDFEPTVKSDAPADVEVVSFKADNEMLISTVLMSEEYEARSVDSINISVKCEKAPKSVVLLSDEKCIDFNYIDGEVSFKTDKMHIFNMYKIEF